MPSWRSYIRVHTVVSVVLVILCVFVALIGTRSFIVEDMLFWNGNLCRGKAGPFRVNWRIISARGAVQFKREVIFPQSHSSSLLVSEGYFIHETDVPKRYPSLGGSQLMGFQYAKDSAVNAGTWTFECYITAPLWAVVVLCAPYPLFVAWRALLRRTRSRPRRGFQVLQGRE
jgi:hypothetical protein